MFAPFLQHLLDLQRLIKLPLSVFGTGPRPPSLQCHVKTATVLQQLTFSNGTQRPLTGIATNQWAGSRDERVRRLIMSMLRGGNQELIKLSGNIICSFSRTYELAEALETVPACILLSGTKSCGRLMWRCHTHSLQSAVINLSTSIQGPCCVVRCHYYHITAVPQKCQLQMAARKREDNSKPTKL